MQEEAFEINQTYTEWLVGTAAQKMRLLSQTINERVKAQGLVSRRIELSSHPYNFH